MSRTAEERDRDRDAIVALVEAATADVYIPVGQKWKNVEAVYRDVRELRSWASDHDVATNEYLAADLKALVRDGRVATWGEERRYGRCGALYTSVANDAAVRAELALTDAERAERTLADVERLYAENQRERGDAVGLWPVSMNYGGRMADGVFAAIEAGLLCEGKGGGYVPADKYDAYIEALAAENARREAIEEHSRRVGASLRGRMPSARNGERRVEISVSQAEWLIDQLAHLDALAARV